MELSNLFGFGLATFGTVLFAVSPYGIKAKTEVTNSELRIQNSEISSPRRLTVTVRVQEPEDLKVQEQDTIKAGQVIADRERERSPKAQLR